jgi:DNA-binding NtrC family response regulator
MPNLSGLEVLEKIKAINPSLEVIIVTAHASDDTELKGLCFGAYQYIIKPFGVDHLRKTVKDAIAHRRKT